MYRSKVLPDSSQLWDKYPQHFIWHILIPPEQGRPRTKQRTTLVDVIEQHKAGEYCMRRTNLAISDCLAHANPRRWRRETFPCVSVHVCIISSEEYCASPACAHLLQSSFAMTSYIVLAKVCCHCHPGPVALWLVTRGRSLFFYLSLTHTHAHNQKLAQKANVRPKRVQREHRPTKVTLRAERRRCHLCPTWTQPHKCSQKETNTATCLAGNTARPISSTRQHTQMHCRGNDDEGRVCMDSILALVFFADKEGGK